MPIDPLVTAADILAATRRVRQLGNTAGLTDLEQREPELAGLLLDEASDLNRRLGLMHIPYPAYPTDRAAWIVTGLGFGRRPSNAFVPSLAICDSGTNL